MKVNDKNEKKSLRVTIIHTSNHKPEELEKALISHDIQVIAIAELSNQSLCEIDTDTTDAILVDLHENAEQELDMLEALLEESTIPLLFNDNATTQFNISISTGDWSKKLAIKLHKLVSKSKNELSEPEVVAPAETSSANNSPVNKKLIKLSIDQRAARAIDVDTSVTPVPAKPRLKKRAGANTVWVLGASLGGPLAVKDFLSALPEHLPVAFVLAQHIGASHIELLGEQLNRATNMSVMTAQEGHIINENEVILAPIEKRIVINNEGRISLKPIKSASIYSPSIDDVMFDIANQYESLSGAIVFSGMGNDGEEGCKAISEKGGVIWAQEPDSCVISSMPDCARRTGSVSYNDTPEGLANNLVDYLTH